MESTIIICLHGDLYWFYINCENTDLASIFFMFITPLTKQKSCINKTWVYQSHLFTGRSSYSNLILWHRLQQMVMNNHLKVLQGINLHAFHHAVLLCWKHSDHLQLKAFVPAAFQSYQLVGLVVQNVACLKQGQGMRNHICYPLYCICDFFPCSY